MPRVRKTRPALIFAAPLAALAFAGCEREPSDAVPLYDSAPVETRDIRVNVEASGVIEPERTVEVKSKASGEILNIGADTGDVVEKGDLLVEIDKRTPRNQLAEAEASLEAARARRQIARTQLDRSRKLHESGTLTQTDFEQAQLEFANAQAQVVGAEVAVENARIAMDDTSIRAPITGTVIERHVEPGAVISSPTQAASDGTVLMRMADLSHVQVRALVDETDIGKIRPGMEAEVVVSAYPNQPFHGEVLKIEPQAIVEQNVTMFAVLVRLANDSGLLKPGMNAEVRIEIAEREDVAAVPTAALRGLEDLRSTAAMLGIEEAEIRRALAASGASAAGRADAVTIAGRTVELPDGVDREQVEALLEKQASGAELSDAQRTLLRTLMGRAFGEQRGGAGGPPAGGPPRGAFGEGSASGGGPGERNSVTAYQFGGEYWVVALRDNEPVPLTVETGLTDLEYSEVVSGLELGERVLLLPSTSLFEQQERLQQFISERFSSGPFQGGRGF